MREALFGPESWAPLAKALVAYAQGRTDVLLKVYVDDGEADPLPVSLFFRSPCELRDVDREALARAQGHVLDVGASVGSIALALQERGVPVTALEVVPEAVRIMSQRGIREVWEGRTEDLPTGMVFDTILVLMNGIALAGSLAGVPRFLRDLGGLLDEGGQILLDSTDLLEASEERPTCVEDIPPEWYQGDYPGEHHYQMEFGGVRGAPFPQVFLDPGTLSALAEAEGFESDVVWWGMEGLFLARLRKKVKLRT
jgi:hypothetical protein